MIFRFTALMIHQVFDGETHSANARGRRCDAVAGLQFNNDESALAVNGEYRRRKPGRGFPV